MFKISLWSVKDTMDLPIKTDDVRFSLPEVLDMVSTEKFHDEKIKILQLNENLGLSIFLKKKLTSKHHIQKTESIPTVKSVEEVEGVPSKGLYQLSELHKFISGTPTCENLNDIQRERQFMSFCVIR